MPDSKPQRPRDPNQLAKRIVDLATGEVDEPTTGSARGSKGGKARAAALTAEERRTIARKAAAARWKKPEA